MTDADKIIAAIDGDKNGKLSKKDMLAYYWENVWEYVCKDTTKGINKWWSRMDTDNSGELSKEEIIAAVKKYGLMFWTLIIVNLTVKSSFTNK